MSDVGFGGAVSFALGTTGGGATGGGATGGGGCTATFAGGGSPTGWWTGAFATPGGGESGTIRNAVADAVADDEACALADDEGDVAA
jgi:hypothetical protein